MQVRAHGRHIQTMASQSTTLPVASKVPEPPTATAPLQAASSTAAASAAGWRLM
jgi:hypothetical protein